LTRTHDFLLGPVNERKILAGDFVISLDPERRYKQEKDMIRCALPSDRVQRFEDIADRAAARLLPKAPAANLFEVVEYAELVTVAIVKDFWGLDPAEAISQVVEAAKGEHTMRLWLRKMAI